MANKNLKIKFIDLHHLSHNKINLFKFFLSFLVIILLIFPFELNKTEAASTTFAKTVEFFIGQDGTVRGNGEQFSFYFNNINLSETPTVKSAIVEINGVSYNNSGNQTINVDLKQGILSADSGVDYVLGGTTKPKPFTVKYDAWQGGAGSIANIILPDTIYDYTLYLKDTSAAGSVSFSIASAKLILTYNYSVSGANFLKTNKFFISQEKNLTPANSEIKRDFSITIPESSPETRSVFVEVSGVAKGTGVNNNIQLSVVKEGLPVYNTYNIDLGILAASSKFIMGYDMTSLIGPADFPIGNYSLYVKNSFDAYLLNAKAVVTYKYSVNIGNLPVKGELISSTFDTGIAEGAAYNSLMWKGDLNGGQVGQVGLQIAASNCLNGKTNPPSCDDAGTWSFEGPQCNSATSYTPAANTTIPIEIACALSHNNKRYFRYKVIICSSANCADSGSINPEVTEVVVNWGP